MTFWCIKSKKSTHCSVDKLAQCDYCKWEEAHAKGEIDTLTKDPRLNITIKDLSRIFDTGERPTPNLARSKA